MQQFEFDNFGKIKAASAEDLQKADKGAVIIAYTTGTTESGRQYYAYVAVKPSKYREFCERSERRESLRIADYGKIIVHGFEKEPPASVVKHMRDKHGFDDEYEARLKAAISAQRKQFSIDKEEQRLLDIVAMMKAAKK